MSTLKVGIASTEEMKARTLAIARGEMRASSEDPKVWFMSPNSFAKMLSNKGLAQRGLAMFSAVVDTRSDCGK